MKKFITMIGCAVLFTLSLSACFGSVTTYPDMVEHDQNEVLGAVKEKYDIQSFIFTGKEYHGEKTYDENNEFSVLPFSGKFSADFINGDNIEGAFTSFAGKNGGHDIQGRYRNFLCYVALGINGDGQAKFLYYNLNLDKDAEIENTIGSSDYPYDVLPTEITDKLLTPPTEWGAMRVYMNKHFQNIRDALSFSGDRLSYGYPESNDQYVSIQFYRENNQIVYDIVYFKNIDEDANPQLIYSTSDRYGVIYNYYGLDFSQYVEVAYTVEQSGEDPALDLLSGTVRIKPVGGTIVYSELTVGASYTILRDDTITTYDVHRETYRFTTEVEKGFLMDRIDGIDHKDTAKIVCTNFYILYEK